MPRKTIPSITAETFFQYVTCPSWVWHEAFGKPSQKKEPAPLMKKIMEEGVKHEKAVIADHTFTEVREKDLEEGFRHTVELMKAGKNIYQGVLIDGRWVGRPDFLLKRDGPSKLGGHHYVACDIKSSREVKKVQKFQLTFYSLLLEKIQGLRPASAYIINIDKEMIEIDLDDFQEEFHLKLSKIEDILAGNRPLPFLAGDCKKSPWRKECIAEAEACNDVSLVYQIRKKEWEKLRDAGVTTVTLLADMDFDEISERVPGISPARLETLRTRAVALVRKEPMILAPAEFSDAHEEIHFDIEGDPLLGVEYLFGCLVVGTSGKDEYRSFVAERPEDEGKAWKKFISWISKREHAAVYHYGVYERIVIQRLIARHPETREAGEHLLLQMVDLLGMVSKSVAFPIYFYSLKDIAKFIGFQWRDPDPSGANSIVWYENWLKKKDRNILKRIVEYNEDDVRATKVLKDWLAANAR